MIKRLSFLFIILCADTVYSRSLQELLGSESAQKLITNGEITVSSTTLRIVPRHPALTRMLNQNIQELKPNIMAESLFLYTKPSAADKNWSNKERLSVFNEIVKLSTLKEIRYFSQTRNKMHTLYESSSIIDNEQKARPDPLFRTLPAKSSFSVKQKDTTFGDNTYLYTYDTSSSVFTVSLKNTSPLKRAGFTVVEENNLRSFVAIFDAEQYILIYGVTMGKGSLLPGMKKQIESSINNRKIALLKWFRQKIDIGMNK